MRERIFKDLQHARGNAKSQLQQWLLNAAIDIEIGLSPVPSIEYVARELRKQAEKEKRQ